MGKRAKLTLPWHIKVNLNLKTGFYEGVENGVTYQLNFSQMNDLKIYCRLNHGSIPTLETWYNDLSSFSRKAVKTIRPEFEETEFFPD